jgi:hypothetical protein
MAQKGELHIRNKHNGQYDFPLLIENYPPLKRFVSLNPLGVQTINFFNPQAVKALNKALLISYYGILIILYSDTFTDFNLAHSFSRFFSFETKLVNHPQFF